MDIDEGPSLNEPAVPATEVASPVEEERKAVWVRWAIILGVLGVLGSAVVYLLTQTSQDAFVYSKLVHDVVRNPAAFAGREIRVEGELTPGSIQFRQEPCEWRFQIEKHGRTMPVRFPQCIVPDTFRDGMGISVTVQGTLGRDGTFVANQVVPRCPSKYEMQQRRARGEETPHPAKMAPQPINP